MKALLHITLLILFKICYGQWYQKELMPPINIPVDANAKESDSECPLNNFVCDTPYDTAYTKIFECRYHEQCPTSFMCCKHICFQNKICQYNPKIIPSSTVGTTITPKTISPKPVTITASSSEEIATSTADIITKIIPTNSNTETTAVDQTSEIDNNKRTSIPTSIRTIKHTNTATMEMETSTNTRVMENRTYQTESTTNNNNTSFETLSTTESTRNSEIFRSTVSLNENNTTANSIASTVQPSSSQMTEITTYKLDLVHTDISTTNPLVDSTTFSTEENTKISTYKIDDVDATRILAYSTNSERTPKDFTSTIYLSSSPESFKTTTEDDSTATTIIPDTSTPVTTTDISTIEDHSTELAPSNTGLPSTTGLSSSNSTYSDGMSTSTSSLRSSKSSTNSVTTPPEGPEVPIV